MSEHLGYPPGQAPPARFERSQRLDAEEAATELGPVEVRDRDGLFAPQL